jgi:anti-sigma factor ChrR (cupin superfamily)
VSGQCPFREQTCISVPHDAVDLGATPNVWKEWQQLRPDQRAVLMAVIHDWATPQEAAQPPPVDNLLVMPRRTKAKRWRSEPVSMLSRPFFDYMTLAVTMGFLAALTPAQWHDSNRSGRVGARHGQTAPAGADTQPTRRRPVLTG